MRLTQRVQRTGGNRRRAAAACRIDVADLATLPGTVDGIAQDIGRLLTTQKPFPRRHDGSFLIRVGKHLAGIEGLHLWLLVSGGKLK
ncbi:MAG TPA: hypothetical protein VNE18_09445 [Rhodanobacter sp.]|nr:hypothetical protein [Rhodanobacter sp.]